MKNKFAMGRVMIMVLAIISTMVVGMVLKYLFVPAINLHSAGFWCFVLVNLVILTIFSMIYNAIRKERTDDWDSNFSNITTWIVAGLVVLLLVVFFVASISSWQMFHASQYANLIEITEGKFDEDIVELNGSTDVIIVDQFVAQKLGDRTLGSIKNAGWYDANNEYNLIKIGGEEYRVSPIDYGGFFKYNKAKTQGIPGYILVNAKTQEARFVELDEGMKYSPSAYWSYDLTRHLRNQYPSYIFGKSFFEVDDELAPYWVTSVKTSQVGLFGAKMTTSVIVTNAITGESQEYTIEKLPEWVDHVDSVDYLMEIVEYHYRYQNGWWNPSHTGVFYTSYHYRKTSNDENKYTPFIGYNSLVAKDGQVWFYTGLTPANVAETNVAVLLVSPRTGEVRSYEVNGAEESSAQAAAEGLVQNLKYSASFPTIVNIDGIETYFMLMKDDAGLVQRYALCNVAQYSKVVQAETLNEAIRSYKIKLGMSVDDSSNIASGSLENEEVANDVETFDTTGVVTQVAQAEIGGYSYYYFMVDGMENVVFQSSIQNSNLQPLKLVEGARVTITYYDSQAESGVGIVTKIQFK